MHRQFISWWINPLRSGFPSNRFTLRQSQCADGKLQRSVWTGLKLAKVAKHPVTKFRCEKCGYLESYALVE